MLRAKGYCTASDLRNDVDAVCVDGQDAKARLPLMDISDTISELDIDCSHKRWISINWRPVRAQALPWIHLDPTIRANGQVAGDMKLGSAARRLRATTIV